MLKSYLNDSIKCSFMIVLQVQLFPFKATMFLSKLNLIHIICLKYNVDKLCNFEHLDDSQFHFHPLAA